MVHEAQFEAALTEVKGFAEQFDARVRETISDPATEDDETIDRRHLILEKDNQLFYVTAQEDSQHFYLVYPFDFVDFVANGLSEEDARQVIDQSDTGEEPVEKPEEDELEEGESTTSPQTQAALILLKNCDSTTIEQLKRSLTLIGPGNHILMESEGTDEIPLTSFNLGTYIYPYEPDFSLRRFSNRSVELLAAGEKVTNVCQYATTIIPQDEGESDKFVLEVSSNI